MFAYNAPVPPDQFVGRPLVLDGVCGRLNHPEVSSSSVVGGPKTGKTSLLRYLASEHADKLLPKIPKANRLYFDAGILASTGKSSDFWAGIFRDLSNQSNVPNLKVVLKKAVTRARAGSLDVFDLEDVFDAYAKMGSPVVLLIGNFQALLRNTQFWPPDNFLHVIRSLGQRRPRGVAFVLGTTRPLLDLWDPTRNASPYYNIFMTFSLGLLEAAEVSDLVMRALASANLPREPTLEPLVLSAGFKHPRLTSYVLWLCLTNLLSGKSPSPSEIEEEFADPDGLMVTLIREIRALLAPSELLLIKKATDAPGSLSDAEKKNLTRLQEYGLLPPGTAI
jgi:hypothetical protein